MAFDLAGEVGGLVSRDDRFQGRDRETNRRMSVEEPVVNKAMAVKMPGVEVNTIEVRSWDKQLPSR